MSSVPSPPPEGEGPARRSGTGSHAAGDADGRRDDGLDPTVVDAPGPVVDPGRTADGRARPAGVDGHPPQPTVGATGHATSESGLHQAGRGAADLAVGSARMARQFGRRLRRLTHAQGAGETGLGRLIELHALNYAGDALIAIALAGTLFFDAATSEARGRVGLYLLVTMAPYALLAPVLGPLLDRVRSGRRIAMAATFGLRGVLVVVLASAISGTQDPFRLYPAAFGCLVLSRAYGVTRSAALPRLLPPGIGLVSANGRAQLAGVAATVVAGGIGAGIAVVAGERWTLYLCAIVMAGGAVLALQLPHAVDSDAGEVAARLSTAPGPDDRPTRWNVGPRVVRGLRANAALRAYSGFLTFFLAFLLRDDPIGGVSSTVAVAVVVGGAAAGSGLGTACGTLLRERSPEATLTAILAVLTVLALLGAWVWGDLLMLAVVGASAGAGQSLGKLSLDALIQREVPEAVRTSAFARAETVLQLSWVAGAGVGVVLPFSGGYGLLLGGIGLAAALVLLLRPGGRSARPAVKLP